MKVAVFGASGFVGTALVEILLARRPDVEVAAYIHSIGNAWRLSRSSIPTRTVDIRSETEVAEALKGITHVVNCTRGSSDVMLTGLKNLLEVSKASGIKRFVHLSSTAVYGNPPPKDSEHEGAEARPSPGTYGWEKLKQDEMVSASSSSGLDCVILCPPNISGVYSSFVNNVLKDIRNGTFALVDGGVRPNNTIDVDNLAHAIICALKIPKGDGKRIFVTDGDGLTWRDLADALVPLAELSSPIASISADELASPLVAPPRSNTLWQSVKHLASSEVRAAIRRDPRWARVDAKLRKLVAMTGTAIEDQVRHSVEGPRRVEKLYEQNRFSSRYTAMQLLGVGHRIDRARDILGYEPQLGFAQSMERYRLWYKVMHGFGEPFWPLVRRLEAV